MYMYMYTNESSQQTVEIQKKRKKTIWKKDLIGLKTSWFPHNKIHYKPNKIKPGNCMIEIKYLFRLSPLLCSLNNNNTYTY